jgi:hypothetical protein
MNFKFQNYRKTTTKISCECKLISFSSVIHIVECTTVTHPELCALPSMLARNLQFSIWKSDLRFMVNRSWLENVLVSTTLKKICQQLQTCCYIWHINLLLSARGKTIMNVGDENSLKRTFWHNRRNQKDNSHILSLIQVKLYEIVRNKGWSMILVLSLCHNW